MLSKYYYSPKKLIFLANEYTETNNNLKKMSNSEIKTILNYIENSEIEDVMNYQKKISGEEIMEVLTQYNDNYDKYNSSNFYKIIKYRFKKSFSIILQITLLNRYDDVTFKEDLSDLVNKIKFDDNESKWLAAFLLSDDHTHKDIFNYIYRRKMSILKMQKVVCNNLNTKFYRMAMMSIILFGNKQYLESIDSTYLFSYSKYLSVHNLAKFINNYFTEIPYAKTHETFVFYLVDIYGDPLELDRSNLWGDVQMSIRKQFKTALIIRTIEGSLKNDDRSRYWKTMADKMNDVKIFYENDILILFFEKIVVVEFVKMGNAAYIYDNQDFENHFTRMMPKLRGREKVHPSELKYKKYDWDIQRNNNISHSLNWESKMTGYLALKGVR